MHTIKLSDRPGVKNLKKEYHLKKDKIAKRLKEFDIFYSKPYSWSYENEIMKLKKVNKGDDERIFEELCFCIFTANTSAEMGLKAIDAVKDLLINGTAKEMTSKLQGIYRFNTIRPSYIVHTREYLKNELDFKLKENIMSLRQDMESLRDFFAFNKGIKGLGYKEASHFLRNIGFKGYAILDKHILNSLLEFNVIDEIKLPMKRNTYREIEQKMKLFSNEIGIPMDELDLLLWSRRTGRILK
jgi:N-glycosylase/DNA lyase